MRDEGSKCFHLSNLRRLAGRLSTCPISRPEVLVGSSNSLAGIGQINGPTSYEKRECSTNLIGLIDHSVNKETEVWRHQLGG